MIEGLPPILQGTYLSLKCKVASCRSALHLAAAEGHTELVQFMIENTANINCMDRWGGTPLSDAIHGGHSAIAALLQNLGAVSGPEQGPSEGERMCMAAAKGRLEEIRRLVDGGASVNAADYDGRSALHLAAAEGHDAVVEYLVEQRANVQARDRWGADPFQDAVRSGHQTAQKILLLAGASDGSKDLEVRALRVEGHVPSYEKSPNETYRFKSI
jgi:ankyrin repeat protein